MFEEYPAVETMPDENQEIEAAEKLEEVKNEIKIGNFENVESLSVVDKEVMKMFKNAADKGALPRHEKILSSGKKIEAPFLDLKNLSTIDENCSKLLSNVKADVSLENLELGKKEEKEDEILVRINKEEGEVLKNLARHFFNTRTMGDPTKNYRLYLGKTMKEILKDYSPQVSERPSGPTAGINFLSKGKAAIEKDEFGNNVHRIEKHLLV